MIHAEGDADLLIVQTRVSMAEYNTTFVIAEDTDIIVLMCHTTHIEPTHVVKKAHNLKHRIMEYPD